MAYKGASLAELRKRKNPAALQARVKQLASNPATRGLVDTALLERFGYGAQSQQRALNTRLNTPVVSGSTMSNRDLAHEANANVMAQYGPQKAVLGRQEQAIPAYYAAYVKALQQDQQAALQQGTQSANAVNSFYSSGPQAPGSPQGQIGQAQAGTAQLLGQTQANLQGTLQSAAQSGALQALNAVKAKQADLAAQMGAANVEYRGKRRSEELQNVSTYALAGGKLAASQDKARTDFIAKFGISPERFRSMSPAERLKTIKTSAGAAHPAKPTPDAPFKYGYTKKEWLALPLSKRQEITKANSKNGGKNSDKDAYGNTPLQVRTHQSTYQKVFRIAKTIGGSDPHAMLTALTLKFPTVDDAILAGASQASTLGRLGPQTSQALKELGVVVSLPKARKPRPRPGAGAPANP